MLLRNLAGKQPICLDLTQHLLLSEVYLLVIHLSIGNTPWGEVGVVLEKLLHS